MNKLQHGYHTTGLTEQEWNELIEMEGLLLDSEQFTSSAYTWHDGSHIFIFSENMGSDKSLVHIEKSKFIELARNTFSNGN